MKMKWRLLSMDVRPMAQMGRRRNIGRIELYLYTCLHRTQARTLTSTWSSGSAGRGRRTDHEHGSCDERNVGWIEEEGFRSVMIHMFSRMRWWNSLENVLCTSKMKLHNYRNTEGRYKIQPLSVSFIIPSVKRLMLFSNAQGTKKK